MPYEPKGNSVSAKTEAEQVQEFNQAQKATKGTFDLRPVVNEKQFIYRIFCVEKPAIENMIKKGYPIKEYLIYWSESTGEAHVFPVFSTDSVEDVVNRYADLFPIELKQFQKEISDFRAVLNNDKGMSNDGSMAIKLKCPVGLYRALITLDADFWHDKKNINRFRKSFHKLVGIGGKK